MPRQKYLTPSSRISNDVSDPPKELLIDPVSQIRKFKPKLLPCAQHPQRETESVQNASFRNRSSGGVKDEWRKDIWADVTVERFSTGKGKAFRTSHLLLSPRNHLLLSHRINSVIEKWAAWSLSCGFD